MAGSGTQSVLTTGHHRPSVCFLKRLVAASLAEQVLFVELTVGVGFASLTDQDDAGHVVQRCLALECLARAEIDCVEGVGWEVVLDALIEDVVRQDPGLELPCLVEEAVLSPLVLVPAADHDGLQVLERGLVDARVGLLDHREQLTTAERTGCVGGLAVLIEVARGGDVDQDGLQLLVLLLGDLSRGATLVEAGAERVLGRLVGLLHTLLQLLSLVVDALAVRPHREDADDQRPHQDDGDEDLRLLEAVEDVFGIHDFVTHFLLGWFSWVIIGITFCRIDRSDRAHVAGVDHFVRYGW